MLRTMVAGIVVCLCLLLSSCHEEPDLAFSFDDLCKLVDINGRTVNSIDVHDNMMVEWINNSESTIKVVVTDPNVLSGRNSLRLDPGDRVIVRVASGKAKSMLNWYCGGSDGEDDDDGQGGGNTPVNNDPPPGGGG